MELPKIDFPLKQVGYLYFGEPKEYEKEQYGFYPLGMGDIIYNTLRKIIEDNDTGTWANLAYEKCKRLLRKNKRWPDYMSVAIVYQGHSFACCRLHQWITKQLKKLGLVKYEKYRSQTSMTRDPWVMFYCCAIHLHNRCDISFKPPWWLYRPELWSWRRKMLGKWNMYKLWYKLTPARKDYVQVLDAYLHFYSDK